MNSAFVAYEDRRVLDNTLLDLQNSSYPTKTDFNNVLNIVIRPNQGYMETARGV